jgi:hypothetical protein
MLRIPAQTRRLAIAVCAGALLAMGAPGAASAGAAAAGSGAPTRPAVARPGDFCTPAGCRPRSASALTTAAFGATVLAIGWQARRRESRQP